ncbi:MAG: DUF3999 family protein [Acidobacteriaceae bacterium]
MSWRTMIGGRGAVVLLAVAAATPKIGYFQVERPVAIPGGHAGQTCVALDAATYAHAAPGLADVRLYRGTTETAYVVRQAVPPEPQQKLIAPLNLGKHHGTTFEAVMPQGRYSDIDLDITAKNFIATVAVTGSQTEAGTEGTELGMFTIFDLTGQKLGRSMVLHLPESDFRYLYFSIIGPVKPEDVQGLSVERVPAKQVFVTVAATDEVTQKGRESQVTFTVPAHVPVERVEFAAGGQPANFSRDVTVRATPLGNAKTMTDQEPPQPVESTGNLLRVHGMHNGIRIDEEQLAVDAPPVDFGAQDSKWTVTIENGDDAPLDVQSVRLEMPERQLCFDTAAGAVYKLYYGDAALSAPQYDYATLFTPDKDAAQGTLGPEEKNPEHESRPDQRPFTERHPGLLWAALILVVLVLGWVALRTAKKSGPAA